MSRYDQFVCSLAKPHEDSTWRRRLLKEGDLHPSCIILMGRFRATISELINGMDYVVTLEENKRTKKAYLYIRDTYYRLVGKVRLGSMKLDYYDIQQLIMDYWIPESHQRKILHKHRETVEEMQMTDLELLEEYNRRHPAKKKVRNAEIIEFKRYVENAVAIERMGAV